MDFSNIKKIFYIVAIISMLLSIKSRVFAYTIPDTTEDIQIPEALTENGYKVFCLVRRKSDVDNKPCYEYGFVIYKGDLTVSVSSSRFTFYLSGNGFKSYRDILDFSEGYAIAARHSFTDYLNTNFNTLEKIDKVANNNSSSWYYTLSTGWNIDKYFSTNDIYDHNDNTKIIFKTTRNFVIPFFDNLTEIENGYPDGVFISRGDFSENDALYFHLLKITNTVPDGNQSTYYYDSKVFKLTKDSKYYKTYDADTENKYSYYYIDRSALTLDTNSSYLYVLSNSGDSISNSYGILQPDTSLGIYDVVESDTAGVITEQQALNDKITNINNNQQEFQQQQQEFQQQQQEFQNQNSILPETDTNISDSLHFDNSTPQFSNLFTNYFSQLTTLVGDLGNYDNSSVTTIDLPVPYTNTNIPIRSDIVSSHLPADIYFIIQMVWYFIFGKYFLSFILKMYKLFTTGQILDYYSVDGEVITHDML